MKIPTTNPKNIKLLWMTVISGIFSFMLLHRWILTAAKEKSFGRIWQYYVSWADFGFHRRGLLGTLLTESGINGLFGTPHQFAYFFYSLILVISYLLVINIIIRSEKLSESHLLVFAILFSPAIFLHFGYNTGNNDSFLLILFLLAIFYIKSALGLSLLIACGILTHEIFVFFLPCIFLLKFLTQQQERSSNWYFFLPIVAAITTVLGVMTFGELHFNKALYEAFMARRIPEEAYQHTLWSGHFELSSSLNNNTAQRYSVSKMWHNKWYLLLPTLYAVIIAYSVTFFSTLKKYLKYLIFAAILFPISIQLIATDYYRWISMSACLGLFSAMFLIKCHLLTLPKKTVIVLACFSLLAPFGQGSDLARPFPLHQRIIDKLLGIETITSQD